MKNQVRRNKTKIVATLGPTSESKPKVKELIQAGLNVARLNFSHGGHDVQLNRINIVRDLNKELGVNVGLLQDLQGPKIRIGEVENEGVEINVGEELVICSTPMVGNRHKVSTTYESLTDDVEIGDPILIDDGNLELKVIDKGEGEVKTIVVHGGMLKSKKGINLPGSNLSTPSMTQKDLDDLQFGLEHNVDWVALSFVRRAEDIIELKNIIKQAGKTTKVVAKIEKPEAVNNIDEIINVTDAIMVARGDLGVEIPMEEVPVIQKEIIKKCNMAAKPVIVATQMLDSMINNPRPTRAEASDVANAILDGADAVMLSGETAFGNYPPLAVGAMSKIIKSVENNSEHIYNRNFELEKSSKTYNEDRVLASSAYLARDTEAVAITGMTFTGYTAFKVSRFRPKAEIQIFTDNMQLLTQLSLIWGVRGYFKEKFAESTEEAFLTINEDLKSLGEIQDGDLVVTTGTLPIANKERTNTIRLTKVS
ncbi:pyruvate kinase [Aureibacter tunicatorum]|uniref:Pyruvate kinase n=1 Tax=Aureibacter tunicatorum TaxID=866807 RepID=A0AAE3XRU7_9BACT|nr:pyruvate kinase [Aureibacter tunicatorum]MDR6240869.1 pyruvate kinase [Aureibacter tunicatorum]BDD03649.1 pyruvate kinase [Aureibacter tunicatorum]